MTAIPFVVVAHERNERTGRHTVLLRTLERPADAPAAELRLYGFQPDEVAQLEPRRLVDVDLVPKALLPEPSPETPAAPQASVDQAAPPADGIESLEPPPAAPLD